MEQNRIRGLDGLRAVSIALVLVCHHCRGLWFAQYGVFGVSVFFVLSGFLITWLLCVEEDRYRSISLGGFYVRRALRILPSAILYLVVVQTLGSMGRADVDPGDFLHSLLFVRNMTAGGEHTGHFWSLAIEEQFYLLWPVIFLLLGNRNRRLVFVGALFVFSPCWYFIRVHYLSGQLNPMSFDLRCVWLLAGCVLALARHDERLATTLRSRMLQHPTVPWLAVVFICYVGSTLFRIGALAPAAQAFGVALVINYAVEHQGGLLNWAPMVWLGNLSYSLYLWQQIFCWRSQLGIFGQFPLNVVAAVAAAACSFYFLERPLAAVRRRVPHIPNTNLFRWNRSWAHIISRAPQQAEHGS